MVAFNKKLKFLTLQQVNVISLSLLQILAAIENYQCSRIRILHKNYEILVNSYKIVIIIIIIIIIIIVIIIFIIIIIIIIIITIIIIIIIRVMCMSENFCITRLFSNFSFSVLCSKIFEVMRLAATRYGETNVDINPFLISNMEKPKILSGFFWVIIRIICTNYCYKLLSRKETSL